MKLSSKDKTGIMLFCLKLDQKSGGMIEDQRSGGMGPKKNLKKGLQSMYPCVMLIMLLS